MSILDFFKRSLSADDFAAMVIQRSRTMGGLGAAQYDPDEFLILFELADGRLWTMNLHNAFKDTLAAAPRKRSEVIDFYLQSVIKAPGNGEHEADMANLMPVVRDSAMFGWVALKARESGDSEPAKLPLARPFAADLSVGVAMDSESSTMTVSQETLAPWGMDADAAFRRAVANLRERTEDAGMHRGNGIHISTWRDVFDASRILLTDMIHRLPVRGEPVAAIPSRNHLLVTGSLDDTGIVAIATIAAQVLEDDTRPLYPGLLILRDGRWSPFDAALPDDIANRLSLARYQRTVAHYGDQKKLLEKIHEKEGTDVFVATYQAHGKGDSGGFVGSAQWTRGVATLLPRCDEIRFFCDHRNEVMTVAWNDAIQFIPGLAAPIGSLEPPRYYVADFPDDDAYKALKARATEILAVGGA